MLVSILSHFSLPNEAMQRAREEEGRVGVGAVGVGEGAMRKYISSSEGSGDPEKRQAPPPLLLPFVIFPKPRWAAKVKQN